MMLGMGFYTMKRSGIQCLGMDWELGLLSFDPVDCSLTLLGLWILFEFFSVCVYVCVWIFNC